MIESLCPKLEPLVGYLESLRERADLQTLERLLRELDADRSSVESSCIFGGKAYKRNTIAASSAYELLVCCWRSGHCTPIHDHYGSSCAFKVIQGVGTEIRYRPMPNGQVCPVSTNRMEPGYVCAAADEDIHQIVNFEPGGTDLITLHMYSWPLQKMRTYIGPVPTPCADRYAPAAPIVAGQLLVNGQSCQPDC